MESFEAYILLMRESFLRRQPNPLLESLSLGAPRQPTASEHYNGTLNQNNFLSFSTDVSSNEVVTYKEAMTQEDAHLFVEAMQKEVADHGL
jgi:hypothetical protein